MTPRPHERRGRTGPLNRGWLKNGNRAGGLRGGAAVRGEEPARTPVPLPGDGERAVPTAWGEEHRPAHA